MLITKRIILLCICAVLICMPLAACTNKTIIEPNKAIVVEDTTYQPTETAEETINPVQEFYEQETQEYIEDNYQENEEPYQEDDIISNYIGTFYITGYDICKYCCGKTDGITAWNTVATVGRTIAASSRFAFGTTLYIDGLGTYVVEDRGGAIDGNRIDVLCNNHEECYAITGYYDVYIVE